MEIAFGVLPLALMVFQGYHKVTTFVSSYKSYDDDSRQILYTVAVLEVTLKENLEVFLKDIIEEQVRRGMLADLNSPHWAEDELNARFEKKLGTYANAVKGAIFNCKLMLDRIHESQRESLLKLEQAGATDTDTSIHSSAKWLRLRTSGKRLRNTVKGLVAELKELCNELRKYISDLRSLFKAIKLSRRAQGILQRDSPPSAISATGMEKARRDAELIHAVTERLHQAVANSLICLCHSVHLCLDGQGASPVNDGGASTIPRQISQELPPQFSFLLAHDCGPATGEGTIPGSMLVRFQPEASGGAVTAPLAGGSGHNTICAEVAVQGEGYERYVHGASQVGSSGFRLRLAPTPPNTLRGCGGDYLSLRDIITTRFRELTGHDRFLIAITLAQSLLHLYCSPWVRDWGINTIYYFTAQEGAHAGIGLWTPYLVLRPGSRDIGDRNRDVYRLGYILLQLGDLCGEEFQEEVDVSEVEMQKVLDRVYRSMGRKYVAFVKRCLMVWGQNRVLNLMQRENLEGFLAHVQELKIGAGCLTPTADMMR